MYKRDKSHRSIHISKQRHTQKAIKISSIQAIYDENYFSYNDNKEIIC